MFRSLRSRLLAMLTGIVVVTVVTIGFVAGTTVRASSAEVHLSEIRTQAATLAGESGSDLARDAEQLERLTSSQVFTASNGRVEDLPVVRARDIDRQLTGEGPIDVRFSDDGTNFRGTAVRSGEGWIIVARTSAQVNGGLRQLALQIAAVLITGLIASWIVGILISYRLTRPLHQLVHATNEIALGRSPDTALAGIPTQDEVGRLALAFRDMAVKLREVDSHDRRFLMSISHELRTPLTAITGHAQALEDGLADDPEMRNRSLAVIRREAGRLDRLVEDIIDLARLRSNRFNTVTESVDLHELGGHVMAIFDDRTAHSEIAVRGEFEHVHFHSDGQRILQILRNLINNALRYAQTEVVVVGERVSSSIRLTVGNDGEPIAPEMQEKIFEAFVGAKREGGMGLGLAIGRELAWALGGSLTLVPRDDGATFELMLPLEPPGSGR